MKKLIIALLGVILLASISFGAETKSITPSVTVKLLVLARDVSMSDVNFGTFFLGVAQKVKADTDLAFSANVSYVLNMWTVSSNGLDHTGGATGLPFSYFFSFDDVASPSVDADASWMYVPISSADKVTLSTGDSCDKDSTTSTFSLRIEISTGSPAGDYSGILNLEILSM